MRSNKQQIKAWDYMHLPEELLPPVLPPKVQSKRDVRALVYWLIKRKTKVYSLSA